MANETTAHEIIDPVERAELRRKYPIMDGNCPSTWEGYECTRDEHHDGDHVAYGASDVRAIWPPAAQARADEPHEFRKAVENSLYICADCKRPFNDPIHAVPPSASPEPPIVICAAILCPDGYVVRGHRHSDCLRTIAGIPRYNPAQTTGPMKIVQGFVTSRNLFVNRRDGLAIQLEAGIESARGAYQNELFSEDLY